MKKILTLGLALILCMCSLVLPAFAADGVGYGTAVDGATFNRSSSGGGSSSLGQNNLNKLFEDALDLIPAASLTTLAATAATTAT